jgi:hypothetical protein
MRPHVATHARAHAQRISAAAVPGEPLRPRPL